MASMWKKAGWYVVSGLILLVAPDAMAGGVGGGGGIGGGGVGGEGIGGDGPMPATCTTYCEENILNCAGDFAQWVGDDPQGICEANCAHWEIGSFPDQLGHSLECRAFHSRRATADQDYFCPNGGPYGNTVCGDDNCEVFCEQMSLLCTGDNLLYEDTAACEADCQAYVDATEPYYGNAGDMRDTFRCRGYHLTVAALDPDTHCQHAGGPNSLLGNSEICGGESGVSSAAGTGGSTGVTGSGPTGSGGSNTAPRDEECSCRVVGAPSPRRVGWGLALMAAVAVSRRRRR
jgi:MYXO-CTERM domain-containing protein